jgi:16S rRNA (cytosine967-C5)-methyltransferase
VRIWSCALPTLPAASERIWRVVARVAAEIQARPTHAGPILSAALRNERGLGAKERPVAGDLLSALLRHPRALARIDPDPLVALRRVAAGEVPDLPDPDDAYAVAVSLPDDLAAEWWERLGPEAAVAHARLLAQRAPVAVRVLRGPVDLPVPSRPAGPHGRVLEGRVNLHVVPAWTRGRIEVQDLGSQRIVDALAARLPPGARILDACAGAGGKALSLAALGYRVQAWDVRPDALRELSRRAARCGLDVRIAPPGPRERFDAVLIDAPCSGTGVLRRHPENRTRLSFPTQMQAELLSRARSMAPGVLYATCSLADRENGALVRRVAGEPTHEETVWPGRPLPAHAGLPALEDDPEGFYWAWLAC